MKPKLLLADIRLAATQRNTRVDREGPTPRPKSLAIKPVSSPPSPPLASTATKSKQQQLVQEAMSEIARRQQQKQAIACSNSLNNNDNAPKQGQQELVFLPHTAEIVASAQRKEKHAMDSLRPKVNAKFTNKLVDGRYNIVLCDDKILLPSCLRQETLRYYFGKYGDSPLLLDAIQKNNIWLPNMQGDVKSFLAQKNGTARVVGGRRPVAVPSAAEASRKKSAVAVEPTTTPTHPTSPATTSTYATTRQQARATKRLQQAEDQKKAREEKQLHQAQKRQQQLAKEQQKNERKRLQQQLAKDKKAKKQQDRQQRQQQLVKAKEEQLRMQQLSKEIASIEHQLEQQKQKQKQKHTPATFTSRSTNSHPTSSNREFIAASRGGANRNLRPGMIRGGSFDSVSDDSVKGSLVDSRPSKWTNVGGGVDRSLRPGMQRGNSFSCSDDSDDTKEPPKNRVSPHGLSFGGGSIDRNLRPGMFRGGSFSDTSDEGETQPCSSTSSSPSPTNQNKPKWGWVDRNLRPGIFRGKSVNGHGNDEKISSTPRLTHFATEPNWSCGVERNSTPGLLTKQKEEMVSRTWKGHPNFLLNSKKLEPTATSSKGLEKKTVTKKIPKLAPKKEEPETSNGVPKKSVWAFKPKWLLQA